jgi:radical SAM superfamily enzyme YgiQ (UPF0313 family)
MNVTFVFPRLHYSSGDPPLGIAYVAAKVRNCFPDAKVSIIDSTFNRTKSYIENELVRRMPDVVGIYSDTIMYDDAVWVAKLCRQYNWGEHIIFGGPHATVMPRSLIEFGDVCVGRGDQTIIDYLSDIEKCNEPSKALGLFGNLPRENYCNPDCLPFPARDLLPMDKYLSNFHLLDALNPKIRGTSLITSFGCPYNCRFCQPTLQMIFGQKVWVRTPESVVDEIVHLKETYKIDGFFFHDDIHQVFIDSWGKKFCRLMKEENLDLVFGCNCRVDLLQEEPLRELYGVGLRVLHIGVESASQRILNLLGKGTRVGITSEKFKLCKKLGIKTLSFFMLGSPTETEDEINTTIDFAAKLDADEASFSLTKPLPGTSLYERFPHSSQSFSSYDYYGKGDLNCSTISYDRLRKLQRKAILKFYLDQKRWGYIAKHVSSIDGLRKMKTKLWRYI